MIQNSTFSSSMTRLRQLLTLTILLPFYLSAYTSRPNIVLILSDDQGYHDIGYHTPSILTPNLDTLAKGGVMLEQYYTQPLCTASRASLLTGRYPMHFGYQRVDTRNQVAVGLPLNLKLLPQALKELGYATHIIGKWHLGFYKSEYLPTNRGFDTFLGFYGSSLYHYSHLSYNILPRPGPHWALDLHNNSDCVSNLTGEYSTAIFTRETQRIIKQHNDEVPLFLYLPMQLMHTPNQVPQTFRDPYSSTVALDRQIALGMLSAMDESVRVVVSALKEKGAAFWNNTIVIFASDNGGWTKPGSSGVNYPLRGGKFTLFEGGIRVPAFAHSPLLSNPGRIENGLFHVSDWYPTLVSLAGGNPKNYQGLDGVDQSTLILRGLDNSSPPTRSEILHNMYSSSSNGHVTSAIRVGNWKLLTGRWAGCNLHSNPYMCGWIPPPSLENSPPDMLNSPPNFIGEYDDKKITLNSSSNGPIFSPFVLFNIKDDPNEYYDVSKQHMDVVIALLLKLQEYWLNLASSLPQKFEWKKMAVAAEKYGCLAPWDD